MAQDEDEAGVDLVTYQGRRLFKGQIEGSAAATVVIIIIWGIFLLDRISCCLGLALNSRYNER